MRRWTVLALVLASLTVAGCSGSDDSGEAPSPGQSSTDPSGIWVGTQAIVGDGVYDMKTIVYGGKVYGISEDAGVLYAGTYAMAHGRFLVSDGQEGSETRYRLYDIANGGAALARGVVTIDVEERERFTGAFSNEMGQEGELVAYYSKLYEKPSSLAYVEGSHVTANMDIDVAATGEVTGAFRGCRMDGTIRTPASDRNLYVLHYALSDCAQSGDYDGFGVISSDEGQTFFSALAGNGARMNFWGFALEDPPAAFAEGSASRVASVPGGRGAARVIEGEVVGENYDHADLRGESFSDRVEGSSFVGADLSHASFDNTCCDVGDEGARRIVDSDFSEANLTGAHLSVFTADEMVGFDLLPIWYLVLDPSTMVNANFGKADFSGATVELDAEDSNFSSADFDGAKIQGETWDCDFSGARFPTAWLGDGWDERLQMDRPFAVYDGTMVKADFTDANFVDVTIVRTNLTGANFADADLSRMTVQDNNMQYANLEGASLPGGLRLGLSLLGNAWWTDGSRCAVTSIGICVPKIYDNGLTYEEYLNGKSDLEKDFEKARQGVERVAEEGTSLVKKVWSSIW